jgi:NADPH:quinone reductase
VPLRQIFAEAAAGRLDVKPTRVFGFDEIYEAHRVMEANESFDIARDLARGTVL